MKKLIPIALAAVLSTAALAQEPQEARLLRFPATNGREVVFTYAGDLWTAPLSGGQARRLTSHVGFEIFARYSPDGKTIAFTGEYDGNREVYTIPAGGGEPFRVTWTATNGRDDLGDRMGPNNMVLAWTPDGKSITYRNRTGDGFHGKLWTVSPQGGMPQRVALPEGGFCSWSPDGKQLAYNRVMREFRTWKYYRGGMADDVWVWDPKAKKVENVTNNDAQDIFPMWIGDEIFFASDRDNIMNLFSYNTKTRRTEKVTNHDLYDVKFPSTDGKVIVYENGGYIYKFDPATRRSEQLHITLATDAVYGRTEQRHVSMRSAAISPDGGRFVVTARGEVFDVPVGPGVTRNLSRTPGSNDRGADWSPDGKWIAWIGDGSGETEVYLYDVEKGGEAKMITKGNDTYIRSLQFSPDSRKIFYTDRKNRIVEVDVASHAKRTILENPEAEFMNIQISPDSKWLAYTRPAKNEMNIVYLYNLAAGKECPVTERWYNSGSPTFSTDGKYLIFTEDRDLTPTYSSVEWNYAYGNMGGVYMAMLSKDTPSPLIAKDGTPAQPGKEEKAEGPVEVRFDPDGIVERTIKLPVSGRRFYCDGKKLWFNASGKTRVFDFATQKTDDAADGQVNYRPGDKKAWTFRNGALMTAAVGPKMNFSDKAELGNMVATVDFSQEWPQLFDEVWRAFRDGYYVQNMHGRNWKAVKEKYAVLLPYARTRMDVNYVIGEMISELASGHAYVTIGEYPKPERIPMGLLGAVLSKSGNGFRVDHILPGAPYSENLRSPLTEPGLGVKEGDVITAVDGQPLKDVDNIYKLLVGKAGVLTELTFEKAGKVVIKPIADEDPLFHLEWVQQCIKTVDEKSGGKVGYIYIPDMSADGLNEFVRYYYPQLDKEALIIDDRSNGGGNVSPMIIERLQREVYRMTMRRGSTLNGTIPEGTHHGPKVLLVDKYSCSDGDLFPWSFKATGLGTIIGTRTWGGIVGISGSLPYMDGTDVRVPFFTNYDAKTGNWIVENHGVDPDIVIDNDPVQEEAGIDQQLLKAVEVALEQIKTRKPLPDRPADRTFKDLGLQQMP